MGDRPHVDALIVGGGHAGAEAAFSLRQAGYPGTVALLGEELIAPYERPSLSKEYLAGKKDIEQLLLRPDAFWTSERVDLLTGRRVTAVDAQEHTVTSADGESWSYGALVWAAGGSPRRLGCPGHDLAGIHAIRSKADCDQLIAELPTSARFVVIGGGYVGLEAAAVLREMGKQVAVVEALDRVLSRVAAEPVSRFYEAEHRAHGVDLHLGTGVAKILGEAGAARGVELTDGRVLSADQVIVGIGIEPAVGPLAAAGAELAPRAAGVMVDEYCRTSLPDVYAVGDCVVLRDGAGTRIESRQNAHEQAKTAARAIAGIPQPLHLVPWFWSNQYDLRLQTVGLNHGYDQTVLRGDPATRSFSLVYLREGAVVSLDCVNAVKDFAQGRKLVERAVHADPGQLADPVTPLKALATQA